MNARAIPTEAELHAYLDGELAEDRRPMVEAYLRDHLEEARRLEAYRTDGGAIARIFSRTGDVAVPRQDSRRSRSQPHWVRAAALALFIAGTLVACLAWLCRHQGDEDSWPRFGAETLAAHQLLINGNSPPVMAVSLHDVSQFFSTELRRRVTLREPADSDYRLVGSKFHIGSNGRVVQLAFLTAERALVTMYFQPWPGRKDAPFRPVASHSDLITLAWTDDELGCAVTAALAPDELERVARSLYEALIDS